MAGSYEHCVGDGGEFTFDLIENMGDAHEACEDMFNMIRRLETRAGGGLMLERIELKETCGACPEQYDAYLDGNQIGYLRLRHGYFRVDFGECGGPTIYEADTLGDGCFEDSEREHHLIRAKEALVTEILARRGMPG